MQGMEFLLVFNKELLTNLLFETNKQTKKTWVNFYWEQTCDKSKNVGNYLLLKYKRITRISLVNSNKRNSHNSVNLKLL